MTLRTIMVLMILFIATLIFASVIMGWNSDINELFKNTFEGFSGIINP